MEQNNTVDLKEIAKEYAGNVPAVETSAVVSGAFNPNEAIPEKEDIVHAEITKPSSANELNEKMRDKINEIDPTIPEEAVNSIIDDINASLEGYVRELLSHGLTPEDAITGKTNRALILVEQKVREYLAENPATAVIEINKKDADKLEFTEEEHNKLSKVNSIKLVMVEDDTLFSLKVKKIDAKFRTKRIKEIEGSLSQYSVPFPSTVDHMTFTGAQSFQLVNAVYDENTTLEESTKKKASLIYEKFMDGTRLHKTDDNGAIIMSYDDFISKFKFYDIDLALYAIYVASTAEETTIDLTCQSCHTQYEHKYNIKSVLNLDSINEDYKQRYNSILENKNNERVMDSLNEKFNKAIRFKSNFTNNVYEVSPPSIAKAIRVFESIDDKNQTQVYYSALATYINAIYVYDSSDDSYIKVDEAEINANGNDNIKEILDIVMALTDNDIQLITKVIRDITYTPEFVIKSKCTGCGKDLTTPIDIASMVFLKAQDTQDLIR